MGNLKELERKAIERLKDFEPDDECGYYLCYSGGKDSDVIRILAELAGVRHEIHHNHTSVDAPETVRYIRTIPNVHIDYPVWEFGENKGKRLTMWNLIPHKGYPPTRIARFCCDYLKERGGAGRLKITGVRKAESIGRMRNQGMLNVIGKPKTTAKIAEEIGADYELNDYGGLIMNMDNAESRRVVEVCYRTTQMMLNPIIDWETKDVWNFLKHYGCKANPLYQCGESRVGCVGCPLAGAKQQYRDFEKYPKYRLNYVRAFERMLKRREELGKAKFNIWSGTGESVMRWWLGENPNQITFEDLS